MKWNSESQGDLIWHGETEIANYTVSDKGIWPAEKMFDSDAYGSMWHSLSQSNRQDKLDAVTINFKVKIKSMKK